MRICILSRYPPDEGGIATHSYNLTEELINRGHDVTVITYKKLNRKSKKIKIYEIPIINKFFLRGCSFYFGVLATLMKIRDRIDLIHVHPIHAGGIILVILKRIYGIPFVITSHGSDLLKWSEFPIIGGLFSWIANSSDMLICVSNFLAKKARRFGIKKSKIRVVYDGIKIPNYLKAMNKRRLKQELGLSVKKKTILFVGSLRKEKGADVLLDISKGVDEDFVLIGDGPLRSDIEESIRKYNIKNVKLLGPKEHGLTLKFIRAADLVIVPSKYEGFGLVAAEAMILGTAVVARPVAALKEILTLESLSNNLERKIIEVLNNKQLRNNIIKKNKELARSFTQKNMVDQIEKIYEEVCHKT